MVPKRCQNGALNGTPLGRPPARKRLQGPVLGSSAVPSRARNGSRNVSKMEPEREPKGYPKRGQKGNQKWIQKGSSSGSHLKGIKPEPSAWTGRSPFHSKVLRTCIRASPPRGAQLGPTSPLAIGQMANYGLRKIRFGHSRMQPIANDSRAARLRRAGAPGARQRTCNAPARRCAPRRNRVPVSRAGDAQAGKVGSRSAKCFLFDNIPPRCVACASTICRRACDSELPQPKSRSTAGSTSGIANCSRKCFQKCSAK